jgi:hypothetical protein
MLKWAAVDSASEARPTINQPLKYEEKKKKKINGIRHESKDRNSSSNLFLLIGRLSSSRNASLFLLAMIIYFKPVNNPLILYSTESSSNIFWPPSIL